MGTRWTPEQVSRLAPDQSCLTSARRLARPGPWSDTGSTDTLVWGKCQGSGSTPYQVSVDLTGPAFTCTCPSRKHPCKHSVALLMRWAEGGGQIADGQAPDSALEWAQGRATRAAQGAARAAGTSTPHPVAQAKRLEERLSLMTAGMEDFARWLEDLARSGTASARHQRYAWWDTTAARLVDAQLPGLAAQVRDMASEISSRPDWADHLLLAMGRWWTATQAWLRRERLDGDELGDLRAFVGWATPTESVRGGPVTHDRWTVLGAHRSDDGRLQQQRTWLYGETCGQTVQVLDFAAGGQVLPVAGVVGSVLDATLACYPGRAVRRALFTEEPVALPDDAVLPAGGAWSRAYDTAAQAWALNPWAARVPLLLHAVRAGVPAGGGRPVLVDAEGLARPVTTDSDVPALLALTGGTPTDVFGELEAGGLRPLSIVVEQRLVVL